MRKRIYEVVEASKENDKLSMIYDWFMMVTIITSIIPLAFHNNTLAFSVIDMITVAIFVIDYLLRLFTADLKLQKGKISFAVYPFTPMAIIDLISILPSLTIINGGFKLLKVFRLLRTFKVIIKVFKNQSKTLGTVAGLATCYVLLSALVIFNAEPQSFQTFFDAVYWAAISLTTVGYGDIYAVSTIGRIVTIVSSFLGIAIIALPSGIITAGLLEALKNDNDDM